MKLQHDIQATIKTLSLAWIGEKHYTFKWSSNSFTVTTDSQGGWKTVRNAISKVPSFFNAGEKVPN